jgi:hypothetical protein
MSLAHEICYEHAQPSTEIQDPALAGEADVHTVERVRHDSYE